MNACRECGAWCAKKFCSVKCAAIHRGRLAERPVAERLLEKRLITDSGCWEWQGAKHTKGYGTISVKDIPTAVHRLSFETFKWPLLPGQCVCHTCDNPPCFNPDHLWAGTSGDNNRDSAQKGRAHGFRTGGEKNPGAKLTNEQADEIRRMRRAARMTQREIAHLFGVSVMTVNRIVRGQAYT